MKYKTVPAMPGLSFSAVGFGCWGISGGDVWNGTTDAESIRTVQTAVDLGINLFDVAPVYGLGHAEEILGQALKGRRHEVIIASKCGLVWDEAKNVTLNLKKASLMQEIDDSLRRLQTGYIDIYQMHWADPDTPEEESMEALEAIKASDKIRHIGVTNFSLDRTKRCMSAGTITSHQGLYNLLEHNPTHYHNIPLEYRTADEVLPFCTENSLAFFPYNPYVAVYTTFPIFCAIYFTPIYTENLIKNLAYATPWGFILLSFVPFIILITHSHPAKFRLRDSS